MSENLNVKATITADDNASPVLSKLLGNIRKLEAAAKSFNQSFSNIGRAGMSSIDGINRAAQAAAAQMRGAGNVSRSTAQSFASDWQKATNQRVNDTRRMYASLERMERDHQRQIERRVAAEHRAERRAGGRSFVGAGVSGRLPVPRVSTLAVGGAALGAGVGSAIKQRMQVQAAETRAAMFGDLTPDEIKKLRSGFADKAGIKYGVGSTKAIDAAVEGLKAGVAKQFAGEFAELALKAQAGLDIDVDKTANLMGKLSTQIEFSKVRYNQILNAIAVVNNETAANGNEIVEAMKRSLSALATTKMTPEQLAALDATGISMGIQPNKMGTFVDFLTSQIAGADSAHGQRAKDLGSAANALGFDGRRGLAAAMRNNPIEAIQKILETLAKMPEALRTKVTDQIGGRQWSGELLTLMLGKDKLKDVVVKVATKQGFIDRVALQKIQSMQGRWASIQAAFGLAWEKVGGGFEPMFDQVSDAIIDIADRFNFDTIRDHFSALIDGLREGFGFKSWGDAVNQLASQFDAGTVAKWRAFGKGFAAGLSEVADNLKTAFNVIKFVAGGSDDAEGLGKFTAKLLAFTAALSLLSPVLSALALFAGLITTFATMNPFVRLAIGLTALAFGIKRVLDYVSDKIFSVFVSIVDAVKNVAVSFINKVRSWVGLGPIGGGTGNRGASGSWSPTSQKAAQSFQGTVTPASFTTGGDDINSAEYSRMFAGTALANQQDRIVAAAKTNGIPPALLAGIIAHETGRGAVLSGNNPGGIMDPSTGWSRKQQFATLGDGIDATARTVAKNLRRVGGDQSKLGSIYAPVGAANDPRNLNGGWSNGVAKNIAKLSGGAGGGGSAGTGDAVGWGEQFKGMSENVPSQARILAASLGGDVRGKSNAWCARYVNSALAAAGGKGTGSAVANSFQKWGERVDASAVKRNDVVLQTRGLGPNQPGGHVGLATGETRMVNGKLQVKMLAGNDGDAVREHWVDADKNLQVRRGMIDAVPKPADVISNVPAPSARPGIGAGDIRTQPNVTFNIQGGNHDPEALATLVQRRIDESMNWRTHDTTSEYT